MSEGPGLPVLVRDYEPFSDEEFVFHSWLKTYRNSPFAEGIRSSLYYPSQHRVIEQIIARSTVLMAVSKEDGNHIFGYIVFEKDPPVLHWMYVKYSYRGMGMENLLLERSSLPCESFYSHFCYDWVSYTKQRKLQYHPYLAILSHNGKQEV